LEKLSRPMACFSAGVEKHSTRGEKRDMPVEKLSTRLPCFSTVVENHSTTVPRLATPLE
jgi:hypothetical protein